MEQPAAPNSARKCEWREELRRQQSQVDMLWERLVKSGSDAPHLETPSPAPISLCPFKLIHVLVIQVLQNNIYLLGSKILFDICIVASFLWSIGFSDCRLCDSGGSEDYRDTFTSPSMSTSPSISS